MTDPKLNLAHRLELEAELRQIQREEDARAERIAKRRHVALEITKAQQAIAQAEDRILELLPTPLPEDASELATRHPVAVGKRQQLERFEQVFAPTQIDQAESIAKAIVGESSDSLPTTPPKPSRRGKQSGTDGGSP